MAYLNETIAAQLRQILTQMRTPVQVVLVTDEAGCDTCVETASFLQEITGLSDMLTLVEVTKQSDTAKRLRTELFPAVILLDRDGVDRGIRFYGIPAGHEINSFLSAILELSGAGQPLPPAFAEKVAKIRKPVDIKVFVTLGCPHCPGAVSKAHKLAFENPHIRAEMIEASTFQEMSRRYNVSGVPKIVFNDGPELLGDQPLEAFLETLEKL